MATQEDSPLLELLPDEHPDGELGEQLHGKCRQCIKLCSSLKKLTSLELPLEKKQLMENSVFYKFLQVQNSKESSAPLIEGLCKLYDAENRRFVFNSKASFYFCTKEVAYVLGIKDTGTDYIEYIKKPVIPNFVYDLKKEFVSADTKKFKASELKKILKDMPIDDENRKLYFKQLLSYFLVEQLLLCSGNPRIPRTSFWGLVNDLKAFEKINWAKAIFDHICESLEDLKGRVEKSGQHDFKGAAPVLEALIYERIPSVRPRILEERFSDLPIQKYGPQRTDVLQKLHELTPEKIEPCPWCGFRDLSLENRACSPALSLVENAAEDAAPEEHESSRVKPTQPEDQPRRSKREVKARVNYSPSPMAAKKTRRCVLKKKH